MYKNNRNYFYLLLNSSLTILFIIKNIFLYFLINLKHKDVIIINLGTKGIGDIVACEPVIEYVNKLHKNSFIVVTVYYKYKDLLKCDRHINRVMNITGGIEWLILKKLFNINNIKIYDLHYDASLHNFFGKYIIFHNPNKENISESNYYNFGSILETSSLTAGLPKLSKQPQFHFCKNIKSPIRLPLKSIVVHCKSKEETKEWKNEKWVKLTKKLINEGYNIFEIGTENVINLNSSHYFNLCGKYNFQELAQIIKIADIFIGIDSGFAHIANAVKTPGVILLGKYKNYKIYMPYTGFYTNKKNACVIHYKKSVKEIPISEVYKNIKILSHRLELKHRL